MNIISSKARFRQRVLKYSIKKGVTQASIRYRISRKTIYAWLKRYDGSWRSLEDRSHRPHSHPNQHTEEEKQMILRRYPRYKDDMILLWDSLRKSGYKRAYNSLVRVIKKWINPSQKNKKKPYKAKPYKRAEYPGQKVQIDVKFVPSYSVITGKKYYQYTAVDECTRWTYREMHEEHSTYSSAKFLKNLIANSPFPIREIQTDNGTEFTNALLVKKATHKSLFEEMLEKAGIIYHRIRIATPRHNGKVERQHRIDEQRLYRKIKISSLEQGRKELEKYNKKSNKIPKICLNFLSPNECLEKYLYTA